MSPWTAFTVVFTAVTSGLLGGVYLAFSFMVLPALSRLQPARAAAAMNQINVAAERRGFLLPFLLNPIAAVVVLVVFLPQLHLLANHWLSLGAVFALISLILTLAHNVPWNRRLAADPECWPAFRHAWSASNLARGLLNTASAILLTVELLN